MAGLVLDEEIELAAGQGPLIWSDGIGEGVLRAPQMIQHMGQRQHSRIGEVILMPSPSKSGGPPGLLPHRPSR